MTRTPRWDGAVFQNIVPTPGYAALIATLGPGETLVRTLVWCDGWCEYTSFGSMAGTNFGHGLIIGNSPSTAPGSTPLTNWNISGAGGWIGKWITPFVQDFQVPATSPAEYIAYTPQVGRYQQFESQRRNDTTADEYVWLMGENGNTSYPGSIYFNCNVACLILTPG